MHKPLSEEQELLNELKKQERQWHILRWFLPVLGIWMLFDPVRSFQGSPLIGTLLICSDCRSLARRPKIKIVNQAL
jgi:hypothetical protein